MAIVTRSKTHPRNDSALEPSLFARGLCTYQIISISRKSCYADSAVSMCMGTLHIKEAHVNSDGMVISAPTQLSAVILIIANIRFLASSAMEV